MSEPPVHALFPDASTTETCERFGMRTLNRLLVSPGGWLVAPHAVDGFTTGHGSSWSPQSQTFHVAWFTPNALANGATSGDRPEPAPTFTLHLTEISADGQAIESRSRLFEWEAPSLWHVRRHGPRRVCLVGDETLVVTDAGRCSLVFDDDVARCGEVQAPEFVVCNNERVTMG